MIIIQRIKHTAWNASGFHGTPETVRLHQSDSVLHKPETVPPKNKQTNKQTTNIQTKQRSLIIHTPKY